MTELDLTWEGEDLGIKENGKIFPESAALSVEFISVQGLLFESLGTADEIYSFQLHALYNGKSVHSKRVDVADTCKPIVFQFTAQFRDPLTMNETNSHGMRSSILIYITCSANNAKRHNQITGIGEKQQTLIAQATIDYTVGLLYSGDFISVELAPCLVDYIYTTGEAPGSLFVRIHSSTQPIQSDSPTRTLIEDSMRHHQASISKLGRDTLQQMKAWWAKLRNDYPQVGERQLKFITEDECGRHRFVGNFISTIAPGRELNGPRFAARFVSLIPFRREVSLAGGRVHRWHSSFATLTRLQGDVEDHAVLLCSLLTGWGLTAYVAMGTLTPSHSSSSEVYDGQSSQLHCWVVTICETGKVTHWESLTGELIEVSSPAMREAHYRNIWALFRHNEYIANIQLDCSCLTTSYAIRNPKMWRTFSIPEETVSILSHPGSAFVLEDSHLLHDAIEKEKDLESRLIEWLRTQRLNESLKTVIDNKLSIVLHPTLASYELDRATGSTFGNTEFQSAIRSMVEKGECFKAYPTCFNNINISAIQTALLKTKAARDIIYARSKNGPRTSPQPAKFGLRVRVFPYPHGLCAVWLVLAVIYQGDEL